MILFGRKGHHLALEENHQSSCPKCGNQSMVVSLFQAYFHVLWLPFFPLKKAAAAQCLKCRHVIYHKKLPLIHLVNFNRLKKLHATPIWTFTGIFLLIVLYVIKKLFIA